MKLFSGTLWLKYYSQSFPQIPQHRNIYTRVVHYNVLAFYIYNTIVTQNNIIMYAFGETLNIHLKALYSMHPKI